MTYAGPLWTEFPVSQHVSITRFFYPPHPITGARRADYAGTLCSVSEFGFVLLHDDGHHSRHAWDPGPGCHQIVAATPAPQPSEERHSGRMWPRQVAAVRLRRQLSTRLHRMSSRRR